MKPDDWRGGRNTGAGEKTSDSSKEKEGVRGIKVGLWRSAFVWIFNLWLDKAL